VLRCRFEVGCRLDCCSDQRCKRGAIRLRISRRRVGGYYIICVVKVKETRCVALIES